MPERPRFNYDQVTASPANHEDQDLPGGPLVGKPMQGDHGEWYNQFGERISEPTKLEEQSTLTPLDITILRGVHDKSVQNYPDKYSVALFQINMELLPNELAEIDKLFALATKSINILKEHNPNYQQFEQLLQEMRDTFGTLGESSRIQQDPSIGNPTREYPDGVIPVIKLPTALFNLYKWDMMLNAAKQIVSDYRLGQARAQAAKQFGEMVYNLYRLVKETGGLA